ncbi:MAG: uroporphyrinogen decarboxylase family protein [Planctomycetota bacterium]
MTSRDKVMGALGGSADGGPVVICPGGMMSLAVKESMDAAGAGWPEAHADGDAMLRLAMAMHEATGFDNLAMPFCMTVEAEAFGARVDLGDAFTQPRVRGHVLATDGSGQLPVPDFRSGRAGVVLRAMERARALRPDVALVGNLVGPVSLLGMLADPLHMLRWTRKRPEVLRAHLERVTDALTAYGKLQLDAGADVVCIADPTATGEILGGARFEEFALPFLNAVAEGLRRERASIIVHICGDVRPVRSELSRLSADAVSFDSMVDIVALCGSRPPWRVMGNLSAFLLEAGPPAVIARRCRALLRGGVRLLAPACGVIATTPLAHLRAAANAAHGEP